MCEVSEQMCEFVENIRNKIINKSVKRQDFIISIPKHIADDLIDLSCKLDPNFHKQLKSINQFDVSKRKEFIDEYLSTKFVDLFEKLKNLTRVISLLTKKD